MIPSKSFFTRSWAALVVLSVAAMGSAMLAGCRGEDYFCDNTGCYYCDGVGCRDAVPPTRTPCQGDYQCQAGQICTSAGCATTCTSDADCPHGTVCSADDAGAGPRVCRAPTEPPITPNPGSCTTNSDCGANAVCLNGVCHSSNTTSCNADADCTEGNICLDHVCTARGNTCQFNNQCGAGRVCVNSECRSACTNGSCPTGQTCNTAGYCEDAPPTACVHDTDCASGQHCLNGSCLQACTAETSCGTGLFCNDQGVCVPDTRPSPFCTNDSQCAPGSACVNGVCRAPCSTDLQCQMRDVTYRNCGRIPNQPQITQTYCLTDNERATNCTRQTDCTQGQTCLDGVCR